MLAFDRYNIGESLCRKLLQAFEAIKRIAACAKHKRFKGSSRGRELVGQDHKSVECGEIHGEHSIGVADGRNSVLTSEMSATVSA